MVDSSKNFLFKHAMLSIILCLHQEGESYITGIAKHTDVTHSHVGHILHMMKKDGLIEDAMQGRRKHAVFTEKGKELAKLVDRINHLLKKEKNE